MTHYYHREVVGQLTEALDNMPVVILTGMRQSGKSTLLQRDPSFRSRCYISLDNFASLDAARKDPESLLRTDGPVTIDEAQKAPELLTVIKQLVDKKRVPGQFLLSGSANLLLLKNVSESLAGRAVYLTLYGINRRELAKKLDKEPFILDFMKSAAIHGNIHVKQVTSAEIFLGGMPSVCLKETQQPALWFQGYEQTYLERDVRAISRIEDLFPFRTLLHLAALRTGQICNNSELGRDAKLNSPTVARYLSILETCFIISRVGPYLPSKTSRLIKTPKMYISDSGLAAYLMDIDKEQIKFGEQITGTLLENYVFQNLASILSSHCINARLSFWNIQGRCEVDFIIEKGRETIAIEVKSGSRWDDRDLKGLRTFIEKHSACKAGILAYNGTEAVCLGNRLWAIPIDLLLS